MNERKTYLLPILFAMILGSCGLVGFLYQTPNPITLARPMLIQYAKQRMDQPDSFKLDKITLIGDPESSRTVGMLYHGTDINGQWFVKSLSASVDATGEVHISK